MAGHSSAICTLVAPPRSPQAGPGRTAGPRPGDGEHDRLSSKLPPR